MKKLTSILAALFFAITAVFAQDSKTIEVDLASGTTGGFGNSVRLEWKDTQKTYRIQQQKGMGTTTSLVKDNVASPILEPGQYFHFTTTTNTVDSFIQITDINITYEGEQYGNLIVGGPYSSTTGTLTTDPLFSQIISSKGLVFTGSDDDDDTELTCDIYRGTELINGKGSSFKYSCHSLLVALSDKLKNSLNVWNDFSKLFFFYHYIRLIFIYNFLYRIKNSRS